MNHQTRIIGAGETWQAKCSCRKQSKVLTSRTDAKEWERTHLHEVERAKAHLVNRNPSLETTHKWYLEKEQDPEVTEHDRVLWRQLRTELEHRLGMDHRYMDGEIF